MICRVPDSWSGLTLVTPGVCRLTRTTGRRPAVWTIRWSLIRLDTTRNPSTDPASFSTIRHSARPDSSELPMTRTWPVAAAWRSAPRITPAKYGLVMSGRTRARVRVRPLPRARATGLGR